MKELRLRAIFLFLTVLSFSSLSFAQNKVLVFASYEETYYSEYIVMVKALEASGYEVDVRSSASDSVSIYMIPEGTDIQETAGTLPEGSYSQFTAQFLDLFGTAWNPEDNNTPNFISIDGSILDIQNMDEYVALVVVGGTGALDYRVDGTYESQGTGEREVSANVIQSVAEKLNELALDALLSGKPVLAQCHGASLPAFWRVPNTEGNGVEELGISLIKGGEATGYPEPETPSVLSELGINYREMDRVTVTSPNSVFDDNGAGSYKVITTRDWFPQTVAHAARTLINIIETYPAVEYRIEEVTTLIIHGGEVDPNNCSASNRSNDVPCNYGVGDNLPADFTDLENLLEEEATDDYVITVSNLDIVNSSTPSNETEWRTMFEMYDVVIWYKHWSTGVTEDLQNALVNYADDGGGVVALHHGLYNDIDGTRNKDILISELFEVQSSLSGWSGNLTNYNMVSTGYGHFISTYGIEYDTSVQEPSPWSSNSLNEFSNTSFSFYKRFQVFDEIYNNMSFESGTMFGNGVNEITPLFSNDQEPSAQVHTNGFAKKYSSDDDGSVGRLVFFQAGERKENYLSTMPYGQLVRNAVIWTANKQADLEPVSIKDEILEAPEEFRINSFYPNPFNPSGVITFQLVNSGFVEVSIFDSIGRKVKEVHKGNLKSGLQNISIDGSSLASGIYIVSVKQNNQRKAIKITLIK